MTMVTLKRCSQCKEEKSTRDFNKEARKPDGFSAWCKSCKNEHQKKRLREKLQDPNSSESIRKKAHGQVAGALKSGALRKPETCSVCRDKVEPSKLQGHHTDYSKPLEVKWICQQCHIQQHKKEREENLGICPYCQERRILQTGVTTCGGQDCVHLSQRAGGYEGASLNREARKLKRLKTGDRMLQLMSERGFTRTELAEYLSVSCSYVSQVLKKCEQIRKSSSEFA